MAFKRSIENANPIKQSRPNGLLPSVNAIVHTVDSQCHRASRCRRRHPRIPRNQPDNIQLHSHGRQHRSTVHRAHRSPCRPEVRNTILQRILRRVQELPNIHSSARLGVPDHRTLDPLHCQCPSRCPSFHLSTIRISTDLPVAGFVPNHESRNKRCPLAGNANYEAQQRLERIGPSRTERAVDKIQSFFSTYERSLWYSLNTPY